MGAMMVRLQDRTGDRRSIIHRNLHVGLLRAVVLRPLLIAGWLHAYVVITLMLMTV